MANEDEARDASGKWTSGGGGSGGSGGKKETSSQKDRREFAAAHPDAKSGTFEGAHANRENTPEGHTQAADFHTQAAQAHIEAAKNGSMSTLSDAMNASEKADFASMHALNPGDSSRGSDQTRGSGRALSMAAKNFATGGKPEDRMRVAALHLQIAAMHTAAASKGK